MALQVSEEQVRHRGVVFSDRVGTRRIECAERDEVSRAAWQKAWKEAGGGGIDDF